MEMIPLPKPTSTAISDSLKNYRLKQNLSAFISVEFSIKKGKKVRKREVGIMSILSLLWKTKFVGFHFHGIEHSENFFVFLEHKCQTINNFECSVNQPICE